jgi:tryptophanyl-tRNA synthetase
MRVLSGVQPSGDLHIGNYFGAIRQFVRLQDEHECFFFLADLHALTTVQDPVRFRELLIDLATGYLALGLDPARSVVYRQSDVPEVTELSWYRR